MITPIRTPVPAILEQHHCSGRNQIFKKLKIIDIQNIIPNLWFDGNAQEAAESYLSIFKEGKLTNTTYYPLTEAEGLADFQKDFAGKVLQYRLKF